MMMGNEPADSVYDLRGIGELLQKRFCFAGPFQLLHLSGAMTIFLFADMDADIVGDGRSFKDKQHF